MLDIIVNLISSKFSSDAEFERQFNLKPKTVYDWKRGKSSSYKNMLVELADYFNVSTDYLLGKETKFDEDNSNPAFFKLKKGLEPYNLDERDVDFLLSVYKAHIEKNK